MSQDRPAANATPYRGPERRQSPDLPQHWLAQALDEVDYGLLLVDESAHVMHLNHAARRDLDAHHPLQVVGQTLRVRDGADLVPLHEAIAQARQGVRRMLTLGPAEARVDIAVMPLGPLELAGPVGVLLMLGRRDLCTPLSAQMFARNQRLTPCETRVLQSLCSGLDPRDMVEQHNLGLTTIRSHIGAIRAKVGVGSIDEVVRTVAALPPVVEVLRGA